MQSDKEGNNHLYTMILILKVMKIKLQHWFQYFYYLSCQSSNVFMPSEVISILLCIPRIINPWMLEIRLTYSVVKTHIMSKLGMFYFFLNNYFIEIAYIIWLIHAWQNNFFFYFYFNCLSEIETASNGCYNQRSN